MAIELREVGPGDSGAQRLVDALREEVFVRKAGADLESGMRRTPVAEVLAGDRLILVAYAAASRSGWRRGGC